MSAQRVLARARGEIGVKESPAGSNNVKYTREYGLRGAWCVMFLWWCFRHEGYDASVFPTTASTGVKWSGLKQWAQREKRWYTGTPKVGDIVVYSFSHVGIVEKVHGRRDITAIEGNTDSSGSRTGGQVMRKRRTSSILGYFRPNYSGVSTPPPTSTTGGVLGMAHKGYAVKPMTVPAGKEVTITLEKGKSDGYALGAAMEFAATTALQIAPGFSGNLQVRYFIVNPTPKLSATLSKGSKGADVVKLQKLIGVTADGDFGPATYAALRAYEKAHGMVVNGVVGPDQWAKLFPAKVTRPYKVSEFAASPGNTFAVASQVGKVQGHLRVSVTADQAFELVGGRVDLLHS